MLEFLCPFQVSDEAHKKSLFLHLLSFYQIGKSFVFQLHIDMLDFQSKCNSTLLHALLHGFDGGSVWIQFFSFL